MKKIVIRSIASIVFVTLLIFFSEERNAYIEHLEKNNEFIVVIVFYVLTMSTFLYITIFKNSRAAKTIKVSLANKEVATAQAARFVTFF